jgi:lipoprotein Spr
MNTRLTRSLIAAGCFAIMLTASVSVPAISTPAYAAAASAQSTANQKADKIVSFAQSLQGKVKYKYGTRNPDRLIFDCSSFTQYVFAKMDISIKWGTAAQSKQGTYVSKSQLKKGDLIFLSVGTPGKIDHVGIYIGNGKFIHNTTGSSFNGVKTSSLSDYSERYITARRIIK